MKFNRRDFLKYSAAFLTAATVIPRKAFSFDNSDERDLQMLILGDSVMWGQGLLDEQKFWFLTQKWLEKETGRRVAARLEAHSGATIFWRGDQKYPKDRLTNFNGELNLSTPTISQQVKNAVKYYESSTVKPQDVDLILVNGGINDLGAFNLINPFKDKKWIERKAREYCGEDMLLLLESVCNAFVNARIIVTGYYPVISTATPGKHVCDVLSALFNEKFYSKILSFFGLRKREIDVCSFNTVKNKIDKLIAELSLLSETWQEKTNMYLGQAVSEINKKYPLSAQRDSRRAVFVKAPFGAANAYAVPDTTYLWQMEKGGEVFGGYKSNDAFFQLRAVVCDCDRIKLKGFRKETCNIAGTAHPNIKGASEYFKAIEREFGEILKLTNW